MCTPSEWLTEGNVHRCLFDGYHAQLGEPGLAMFAAAAVWFPIYYKSGGDTVLPTVALLATSGLAFAALPGNLAGVAWTLIFMSLTATIFLAIYRTVVT